MGARPCLISMSSVGKTRSSGEHGFKLTADIDVAPGDAIALIGPSGSGKSTLLDLLALALEPEVGGSFTVRDGDELVDVGALWGRRRIDALTQMRGRLMGYVPQSGGLLPFLSVHDNIAAAARLFGCYDADRIDVVTRRLGVEHLLERQPDQLSVGQRQRVSVARALAHAPVVVLADEPTASIDPPTAMIVFELLLDAVRQNGAALVVASHDWELVKAFDLEAVSAECSRDGDLSHTHFARRSA